MSESWVDDYNAASSIELKHITEISDGLTIDRSELDLYGPNKAKVSLDILDWIGDKAPGKLVLVTAMTPTSAGEGKTTQAVGLSMALNRLGKRSIVTLREPSIGPMFGIKGVGTGGGKAQVVPMLDINLHFTGDMAAVGSANNLLAAMIDNHIFRGNKLMIDPNRVTWRRCLDVNDRGLRNVVVGVGAGVGIGSTGITRSESFTISAASEVMAILCLSSDIKDLEHRLGSCVVGYTYGGEPIVARELKAEKAMTLLMREALKPNLVQTTEGTPAFVHGGPFANIAHGTSSLVSMRIALRLSDIVVTEAGFGSDLGAEKFFNIACRKGGLKVAVAVVVASIRALKHHGGCKKKRLCINDPDLVAAGLPNLEAHIANLRKYDVPVVVALNRFADDSDQEIEVVSWRMSELGVPFAVSTVHDEGGEGGTALAKVVLKALEGSSADGEQRFLYPDDAPIDEKLGAVVREMYCMEGARFAARVRRKIGEYTSLGFGDLPVCIAKTQNSLSNDPKVRGVPDPEQVCVFEDLRLSAGAGFIVAFTENINLMPGLPKHPLAERLMLDEEGNVVGVED